MVRTLSSCAGRLGGSPPGQTPVTRERRAALNKTFLRSLISVRQDDEDMQWLDQLAGDCRQAMSDGSDDKAMCKDFLSISIMQHAATDYVDRMADILRSFSLHFNLSVPPDQQISCILPALVTELLTTDLNRSSVNSRTYYRARFSSALWSLVLRSRLNFIDLILMPASQVLGLSRQESLYEPSLRLRTSLLGDQIVLENIETSKVLRPYELELICRQNFADLVQRTCSDSFDPEMSNKVEESVSQIPIITRIPETLMNIEKEQSLPQMQAQVDARDGNAITKFFQQLADSVSSAVSTERKRSADNVEEEAMNLVEGHVNEISRQIECLINDADTAVQDAIRDGIRGFETRDFAAVNAACDLALNRSGRLNNLADLQRQWLAIGWLKPDADNLRDGRVFNEEPSTAKLLESLEALISELCKDGSAAFAMRNIELAKELCRRVECLAEFRVLTRTLLTIPKESQSDLVASA